MIVAESAPRYSTVPISPVMRRNFLPSFFENAFGSAAHSLARSSAVFAGGGFPLTSMMSPPGGVAYAHIHVDFEVMLYILQGHVRHEYGPGLKKVIENQAGDFIFIEPGVPHEVFNMSDVEPVVAVVARSDASEWENIVPYDRKTE